MPLTGQQIRRLAQVIFEHWGQNELSLFAYDLSVDLNKLALCDNLMLRALKFISHMNSARPPRDRELLERLCLYGNKKLQEAAAELLRPPTFYSPTNDPHDAIILDKYAFVDRERLRKIITEFTSGATRVLIIHGDQPGGKSYSWRYIRHLAFSIAGVDVPKRLILKEKPYNPRQMLEQVAFLLNLDQSGMPQMTDEPQLARIDPLINWFNGKLHTLTDARWLVIDDLNDESVTPAIRDMAYALACCAEDAAQNLWVALLGYNPNMITNPELRNIAKEVDVRFPDATFVAEYFQYLAKRSPVPFTPPFTPEKAQEIANLLFEKFPRIDKESMINLTRSMEQTGEKLRMGEQP